VTSFTSTFCYRTLPTDAVSEDKDFRFTTGAATVTTYLDSRVPQGNGLYATVGAVEGSIEKFEVTLTRAVSGLAAVATTVASALLF